MHDTGCLGLVHWDDPEGWYGEGGGRSTTLMAESEEELKSLLMKVKEESEKAPGESGLVSRGSQGLRSPLESYGYLILNPPPTSFPLPSLWVIPVHHP